MALVKSKILKQLSSNYPNFLNKNLSKLIDIIILNMENALIKNERVELRGFGVFDVKKREARIARNLKNGAVVAVPSKNIPFFRMGKAMKDRINK